MSDATLAQGNRLLELVLREEKPRQFLQRLLENWGIIQGIGRGKNDLLKNPYASERAAPQLFYPQGYYPETVEEQVRVLCRRLGGLDISHVQSLAHAWKVVPPGADGLYVVPKPSIVAARLGIDHLWQNFGILTEQGPLAALEAQRAFNNYRKGELGPVYHRLRPSAQIALERLEREQQGDLLVFPAQTGELYVGCSVRNALCTIEYGLGLAQWPLPAYCVGWMLFTNSHRLERDGHVYVDCPGDEYQLEGEGGADYGTHNSLYFDFSLGRLHFDLNWVESPNGHCGSASAFA